MVKSSITIASKKFEEIQAIILLQSGKCVCVYCQIYRCFGCKWFLYYSFPFQFDAVIRGWLVRRNASSLHKVKKYPDNEKLNRKSRMKILEMKVLFIFSI